MIDFSGKRPHVVDLKTGEKEFYGHLRRGRGRDEALRAAQMTLIRAPVSGKPGTPPDMSHPFHWAAFQLSGDYR